MIIPYPNQLRTRSGSFEIKDSLRVWFDDVNEANARFLTTWLENGGIQTLPTENRIGADIILYCNPLADSGEEAYLLEITEEAVKIQGNTAAGVFYGIQSLRHCFPAEFGTLSVAPSSIKKPSYTGRISVPCIMIQDSPHYPWRGFMLDEARHFFGIQVVKELLDQMALLKLNRFHWHLTDDQGWRIEIKAYPRLTEVGSKRGATIIGGFRSKTRGETSHQGAYSQDQIREIVAYAFERKITVIPEIDFPGHFSAAISAYPQLSCLKEDIEVPGRFGILTNLACAGSTEVRDFMQVIIRELSDMFPGSYLHIGGDEARKDHWRSCPDCQKMLEQQHLNRFDDLQIVLMGEIAEMIRKEGKTTLVWNEAVGPKLPEDVLTTYWLGNPALKRRLFRDMKTRGRKVIFQPFNKAYMDWPHAWVGWKGGYNLNPAKQVPTGCHGQVLGIQGALWTEFIHRKEQIHFSIYPRLTALAEAAWTKPEDKDFSRYRKIWRLYEKRLAANGVEGAPESVSAPGILRKIYVFLKMWTQMRIEEAFL